MATHDTAFEMAASSIRFGAGVTREVGMDLSDMQRLKMPNGLRAIGYSSSDIPALVEATLPQHRVTKLAPRPAAADDLAALFEDAMRAW